MPTYSQIAYAIQDFSKTISDDSIINIEHIMFLMGKYRNYLIANSAKEPSEQTYQTICVEIDPSLNGDVCTEMYETQSITEIPNIMERGAVTIMPPAGFKTSYRFQYVNYQKYQFVGHNKYFHSFVYVTIGPDGKLHAKSHNTGIEYLEKLRLTAIFDDIEKASMLSCDENCETEEPANCSLDDKEFPLDAELVPTLMKVCVQDIIGAAWQPRDDENNANDDLAQLAQILNRYTNNAAKRMINGNRGEEEK